MITEALHPLAEEYLDRLRQTARRLPRGRRGELVADIEGHLSDAIPPGASDAEALSVLDRLGEPEEIVAAESRAAASAEDPRGNQEWAAIFLLLFGGFVFGVGWLAGLVFLWGSRAWSTRDKWIGTLIFPGGLAGTLAFLAGAFIAPGGTCTSTNNGLEHCTGGPSTVTQVLLWAAVVALIGGPIITAIYLARRAGRALIRPGWLSNGTVIALPGKILPSIGQQS